ncbi:hypothetical protein B0H15DRAFT_450609 [Mycena belliarum]|uniref:Uncharacterized protein n=1 Tax=Mycena belliarum TaxID=1033014 RepID=A0AAD6U060_9AGAR|nr:hypothetical protein B0H15DRAFT_450609 [Mycena belliae]
MPASPVHRPWPERTAIPPSVVRHTSNLSAKVVKKQVVADQEAIATAKNVCEFSSGNEVISCFPTVNVSVPQAQWTAFVWNSNNPDFTQAERVDVYLFHGDSLEQILFWPSLVNPKGQAGSVPAQVNDSWWGDRGSNWAGQNISYPFYFLISRAGEPLSDGTQKPQTTFSAVQTTFADSVIAAMSSSTAASSGVLSSAGGLSTMTPTGKVQSSGNSSSFPTWAIVIIVLVLVAAIAICGCMLFIIQSIRQRGARDAQHPRSRSPSMTQPAGHEPFAAAGLARGASVTSDGPAPSRATSPAQRPMSPASTASRQGQDARAFSHSDAAVMAAAFRAALRQPGRALPEDAGADASPRAERQALLERELGDAGTDIRRVESVRGVHVESSSEGHGLLPRRSF